MKNDNNNALNKLIVVCEELVEVNKQRLAESTRIRQTLINKLDNVADSLDDIEKMISVIAYKID